MTSEHASQAHATPGDGPGYEIKDASVPALLSFGVGLVLSLVAVQFLIYGFYHIFLAEAPKPIKVATDSSANLYQQLRDLHRKEDATLGSYGWVDRKAGVVRIPIDRAIELVAEKGVRFGKGPKTEIEMNSHSGTPVPAPAADQDKTPPAPMGSKP
jgi:hypothetical protein